MMKNIKMITAEEARKNVEGHRLYSILHLDSTDEDVNAERIYETADEVIRQASLDGLSSVTIIIDSTKLFDDGILDTHKVSSRFRSYGYIAAFCRERDEISEGCVTKYVLSLEIVW